VHQQQWIAFGFLAALVIFLGVTIYFPPKENAGRTTLKFLTALSAGFSGGFFTGDALFKYEQHLGSSTVLTVSGAAGCALFFAVWYGYRILPSLPNAINIEVPANWTFRDTVETVARTPCEYVNFRDEELKALTRSATIKATTISEAILQVRLITADVNAVRRYTVKNSNSAFQLTIS
jgi:hypothetical protein